MIAVGVLDSALDHRSTSAIMQSSLIRECFAAIHGDLFSFFGWFGLLASMLPTSSEVATQSSLAHSLPADPGESLPPHLHVFDCSCTMRTVLRIQRLMHKTATLYSQKLAPAWCPWALDLKRRQSCASSVRYLCIHASLMIR